MTGEFLSVYIQKQQGQEGASVERISYRPFCILERKSQ